MAAICERPTRFNRAAMENPSAGKSGTCKHANRYSPGPAHFQSADALSPDAAYLAAEILPKRLFHDLRRSKIRNLHTWASIKKNAMTISGPKQLRRFSGIELFRREIARKRPRSSGSTLRAAAEREQFCTRIASPR